MSEAKTKGPAASPAAKAPAETAPVSQAGAAQSQEASESVSEETQFTGAPIVPGASAPDQMPPSVVGTSQDPARKEKPQRKYKE